MNIQDLEASGPFDVLVIDPPWSYGRVTQARAHHHRGRACGGHYAPMSIAQIVSETPVRVAAPNAHVYLWTTNPKLPWAFDVLENWGFKYQTLLTWEKIDHSGKPINNGTGWYWRGGTEHVLLGTRGRLEISTSRRRSNLIRALRSGHSRKPDEFYAAIDSVYPTARKADLYARSERFGWTVWGDGVV